GWAWGRGDGGWSGRRARRGYPGRRRRGRRFRGRFRGRQGRRRLQKLGDVALTESADELGGDGGGVDDPQFHKGHHGLRELQGHLLIGGGVFVGGRALDDTNIGDRGQCLEDKLLVLRLFAHLRIVVDIAF